MANSERSFRPQRLRRAGQLAGPMRLPTGFAPLDAALAGGWPLGALTEILVSRPGVGELSLLIPALAALGKRRRWIVWVTPPYVPYAPALAARGVDLARTLLVRCAAAQAPWAAEQALASGACGAVLVWTEQDDRRLRRLQLAAERGAAIGFLFRPASAAARPSPAALRLEVTAAQIKIIKNRGGHAVAESVLCPPADRPAVSGSGG